MKNLLSLLILMSVAGFLQAQEAPLLKNSTYLELGGASFFYSVNYDRLLFKNEKHNIAVRVGGMAMPFPVDRVIYGAPVGTSYLRRLRKNYLELGVSFAILFDQYNHSDNDEVITMPSFRVGIRHQPTNSHFFWNALLQCSMVSAYHKFDFDLKETEWFIAPMVSFGAGYSF